MYKIKLLKIMTLKWFKYISHDVMVLTVQNILFFISFIKSELSILLKHYPIQTCFLLINVQWADRICGGNALHVNWMILLKGNTA